MARPYTPRREGNARVGRSTPRDIRSSGSAPARSGSPAPLLVGNAVLVDQFTRRAPRPVLASIESRSEAVRGDRRETIPRDVERLFGVDLSSVSVVRDPQVTATGALATTEGESIRLAPGCPSLTTWSGRFLLGHELAHVLQARGSGVGVGCHGPVGPAAAVEIEADRVGRAVAVGRPPSMHNSISAPAESGPLRCFTVRGHHAIDEGALTHASLTAEQLRLIRAGGPEAEQLIADRALPAAAVEWIGRLGDRMGDLAFSEREIEEIHEGNTDRDMSQVPRVLQALIRGDTAPGDYRPEEHFDGFEFVPGVGWQDWAKASRRPEEMPEQMPIDYILGELAAVAQAGREDPEDMRRLGNALHTFEDFFAHSNIVELRAGMRGQDGQCTEPAAQARLFTGSYTGVDGQVSQSDLAHVLLPSTEISEALHDHLVERAGPESHSQMAKDHTGSPHHRGAMALAGLATRDISTLMLLVLEERTPEEREAALNEFVRPRIEQILAQPNCDDPWWEALERAPDADDVVDAVERAERTTLESVGQPFYSPFKNLEISNLIDLGLPMPLAAGFGGALGERGRLYGQFGAGWQSSPSDEEAAARPILGAQLGLDADFGSHSLEVGVAGGLAVRDLDLGFDLGSGINVRGQPKLDPFLGFRVGLTF